MCGVRVLGTGTVTGLFHFSKCVIRVEFGFINDGKSTDGKISKHLVRVRERVRVRNPYPSTHFGVWFEYVIF